MYQDKLTCTLEITIDSTAYTIPSGNIRALQVAGDTYSLRGSVGFWVMYDDGDDLLTALLTNSPATLTATCQTALKLPESPPDPISVTGIVSSYSMTERTVQAEEDNPVSFRYYNLEFEDAAQFLWTQHHPCELLVDTTLSDVFQAHVMEGISLTIDWTDLDETSAVVVLPLERLNGCSFYDFIFWFTDTYNGVFTYDSQNNAYTLSSTKPEGEEGSEAGAFTQEWFGDLVVYQRALRRDTVNVLNVSTEDPRIQNITQDTEMTGVRSDYIMRSTIAADADNRKLLETNRIQLPDLSLSMTCKDFPFVAVHPGSLITIPDDAVSTDILPTGQEYRVTGMMIEAQALEMEPDVECNSTTRDMHVLIRLDLETKDDPVVQRPAYQAPQYPLVVEGIVCSTTGEDTDSSYTISKDEETGIETFTAKVPLWDVEVPVAFGPALPAQFYFPVFRGNRVLLNLNLHSIDYVNTLNFGPDVQLTQDSQGNQIIMGLNELSRTSLQHSYLEDQPVFSIDRTTDKLTEQIQLSDGIISIQTSLESE